MSNSNIDRNNGSKGTLVNTRAYGNPAHARNFLNGV